MKIVLDGNIGCGKSSILNKIKAMNHEKLNYPIYNEPIADWVNWINLFYSDMSKYSFGFQMKVLKSHLDNFNITNGLFERSPLSCQEVFGKLLFEDNLMSKLEWQLTNDFSKDYGWTPDLVIYIHCDPLTCHQRIAHRNRPGEESISLSYLEKVHVKYTELYSKQHVFKVVTVDGTQPIDGIYNDLIKFF